MDRQEQRYHRSRRIVFVGCRFCGATDRTLRNYGDGKICPICLAQKQREVSRLDIGKE